MPPTEFRDDTNLMEVRKGVSALRDLRDGLAQLTRAIVESPSAHGYLVLMDARLSAETVTGEVHGFKSALRPEIAGRLHVVVTGARAIPECPADLPLSLRERLEQDQNALPALQTILPRPQPQAEVVRVLLLQWLAHSGPVTSVWLAETVGCSYRTVAAAIASLGSAIRRNRDRSVELAFFPPEAWRSLVAMTQATRATVLYADKSGQARSPEYLAQKVLGLMRDDVAIGGVLGALKYCPALDIVGAPRLDVCLHAPGSSAQPLPVDMLDPALVGITTADEPVRLAVHYLRRRTSFFSTDAEAGRWADPVECLLDLHEARLDAQATQLLAHLELHGIGVPDHGR